MGGRRLGRGAVGTSLNPETEATWSTEKARSLTACLDAGSGAARRAQRVTSPNVKTGYCLTLVLSGTDRAQALLYLPDLCCRPLHDALIDFGPFQGVFLGQAVLIQRRERKDGNHVDAGC
jgi:hypothetical protein